MEKVFEKYRSEQCTYCHDFDKCNGSNVEACYLQDKDPLNRIKKFHAHLDVCSQCHDNPFGLCSEGARLLKYAAIGNEEVPQ